MQVQAGCHGPRAFRAQGQTAGTLENVNGGKSGAYESILMQFGCENSRRVDIGNRPMTSISGARGAGRLRLLVATSALWACGHDSSGLFDPEGPAGGTGGTSGGSGGTAGSSSASTATTGAAGDPATGSGGSATTGASSGATGTSGAPGSGGAAGEGGRADAGTPKDSGTMAGSYPFGSHLFPYAPGTILPTGSRTDLDKATSDFYDAWKKRYLVQGCGGYYVATRVDPEPRLVGDAAEITTSEALGYGMLVATIMHGYDPAAQSIFDGMYAFFRAHPSVHSADRMAWEQVDGCGNIDRADNSPDSETGGDLDIALALIMADRQWTSRGNIDYLTEAKKVLAAVQDGDMNASTHLTLLGDWATAVDNSFHDATRPSEGRPAHFRAFASADATWKSSVDASYALVTKMQASATGLLPDFVASAGTSPAPAQPGFLSGPTDGEYALSACLYPWRLGTDFVVSGDARAKSALAKLDAWVRSATADDPAAIVDGYTLAGAKSASATASSWAFTGPFGVAAMVDASNQTWLDAVWKEMVTDHPEADATSAYFGNTIKLLTMIVMSGNWWQP
jgi:hypothetical protein